MCKCVLGSEQVCWGTLPLREITVKMLEMRGEEGGRSEAKGTSGECGNSFQWHCCTTLRKKRERKKSRCSEVMAPSGPCVDFVIGLFPETHLPAVGEKSNTKNRSSGPLPC